jgi:O-antigen/teichoic acid export membrane protein
MQFAKEYLLSLLNRKNLLATKVFSSTLIYAIGPQLPKLVSLLMLPIITKYLTPDDFGISALIMSYLAAFDAFKDLGMGVILNSSFFNYPNKFKFIWSRIFGVIQIWVIIFGFLLSFILYILLPSLVEKSFLEISLLLIIPIVFFDPLSLFGRLFYQLNKSAITVSLISLLAGLTAVASNYYFIVVLRFGYLGFLYGFLLSSLSTFLVYSYLVFFKIKLFPSFNFSFNWIIKKLKISLPTIPHLYANFVLNLSDRLILGFLNVPLSEIGKYSFAYSFGTYFSIIGKSYFQGSGPFIMEYYKQNSIEGDEKSRLLSYKSQIIFISLACIIGIWMKDIFSILVSNSQLRESYVIAIIVTFAYTYYPSYNYNSMKVWYLQKTKLLLRITFLASVFSIVLNFVLIPFFGILGSAIATLFSYLILGYSGFFIYKIRQSFKVNYRFVSFIIFTFVSLSISLSFRDSNSFVKTICSILFLLVLLFFYKKFISIKKPLKLT